MFEVQELLEESQPRFGCLSWSTTWPRRFCTRVDLRVKQHAMAQQAKRSRPHLRNARPPCLEESLGL